MDGNAFPTIKWNLMKKKVTFKSLLAKGVPAVLIPGIIFASIYGVKNLDKLEK